MMTPLSLLTAVALTLAPLSPNPSAAQERDPATRPTSAPSTQPTTRPAAMQFDTYRFVLLAAADAPPKLPAEEARRIQAAHIGHLTKMAEAGHLLAAGPFDNRFDERWRGLCLYDGALSQEEVRELAEADPAVRAGLMRIEVMDWMTIRGALAFPGVEQYRKEGGASE